MLFFLKQSENNSSISRAHHPRKLVAGRCKSRSRRVCASLWGRDLQGIYTQPFGVGICNLFCGKSELLSFFFSCQYLWHWPWCAILALFHSRDTISSSCRIVLIHEGVDVRFQSLFGISKVSIDILTISHCLGLFCFNLPVQS